MVLPLHEKRRQRAKCLSGNELLQMKEILGTMHEILLGICGLDGASSVDETKISLIGVAVSRLSVQRL